jgi:hypothetical protein
MRPVIVRAVVSRVSLSFLLACGASAPPLEAHERAFAGERADLRIGALRCELPMEQLVAVELRFEHATLFLEAAPMGASLESLADDEAQVLQLTTSSPDVTRRATFVGARRAMLLEAGQRRSLVAMTSPWRVLRVRGAQIPELGIDEASARLGELAFEPPGRFLGGTLRGRAQTIALGPQTRSCE